MRRVPAPSLAAAWLSRQPDNAAAYLALATGGDDYALVCAATNGPALLKACDGDADPAAIAGRFDSGQGVTVRYRGETLRLDRIGWRHL